VAKVARKAKVVRVKMVAAWVVRLMRLSKVSRDHLTLNFIIYLLALASLNFLKENIAVYTMVLMLIESTGWCAVLL